VSIRATATEYAQRPVLRPVPFARWAIMGYDSDNLYPQRIRSNVQLSPFGSAAVRKAAEAFAGRGFVQGGDNKVGWRGITANDLLNACAEDYALYGGFCLHARFDAEGNIYELAHVLFENVRLSEPDSTGLVYSAKIWDNWDNTNQAKYRLRKPEELPLYTDRATFMRQVEALGGAIENHPGQLLYFGEKGQPAYPVAPIDPAIFSVQVDAGIRAFQMRNVRTGFMPSHYIELPYTFDNETERAQFGQSLNKFQGANEAGKLMVLENPTDREIKITVVEQFDWDRKFVETERSTREAIFFTMSQPPSLHGVDESGNLSRAQLAEAWQVYNANTTRQRMALERAFMALFTRMPNAPQDPTIQPVMI